MKKPKTMKNSVYALLMLFSVIAFGQEDSAETPKIAIKIPLGETVVIKGIAVKFVEVLEDSRCPTGVTCIWAGRTVVKVEVGSNGNKREKTLIFGETKRGETKDTNLYSSSEFAIRDSPCSSVHAQFNTLPESKAFRGTLYIFEYSAPNFNNVII